MTTSGPAGPLKGAADLAAYRILQESLTNARKHGTGNRARSTSATRPRRWSSPSRTRPGQRCAARAPGTGSSACASAPADPAELLRAIRVVAAGEALLSPTATKGLIARYLAQPATTPDDASQRLATLTPREREIMALVATGLSNDDLAGQLFIRPLTAKTHVNRAMLKLGARDRAQLVVIAYETGIVRAGQAPPHR